MKMVAEWFVMMFLGIIFFAFGLFYMNFAILHDEALQLEEYAIMMIEHHNGYTPFVRDKIAEKTTDRLRVQVEADDNGESISYVVSIYYQLKTPFTHKILTNRLYSMTKT